MCRSCGAIVGAGETSCAQCGVPLANSAGLSGAGAARRSLYDGEAMRFASAVLTRPYIFTIIFLVANLFVFLLMWSSSGLNNVALMEFPTPVLIAYGAKLNALINEQHEWWRFVTPIFIHVNLFHLLVNMYGLWMVGPYVEKLYGSAKFVVFWVLTGVAGVVASYLTVMPSMQVSSVGRFLFKAADVPSAGASGALFGLVGVLFVFGIKFRHELPEGFKRAFGVGLLPMILLNLFIGYLGRGFIDNAAHLGGLVSGALLALVVGYKRPGEPASVAVFWHILQATALVLVAVSFLMVMRNFNATPPNFSAETSRSQSASGSDVAAHVNAVEGGERAFVLAYNKGDTSAIDPAISALESAPHLDERADALRRDLKSLLERARELQSTPDEREKQRGTPQQKKLLADFESWQENNVQWAKANSQKYRLTVREEQPPAKSSPAKK